MSRARSVPYLEFLVAAEEQHIDCLYLIDVSMPLEFLPHFGPQLGYGHVERVHGLDLGSL